MIFKLIYLLSFFIQLSKAKILVSEKDYLSMPDLFHIDNFDECLRFEAPHDIFCTIKFQLEPIDKESPSKIWNIIEKVSADDSNYNHKLLRHGICLSKTCPNITLLSRHDPQLQDKLTECYNAKYAHMGLQGRITEKICKDKEFSYPIGVGHYIFAIVMGFFAIFLIYATVYESAALNKPQEEYDRIFSTKSSQILQAFSIRRNWMRLKFVDWNKPEVKQFRFIQGVRFYNMLIVIFTHTVMIDVNAAISNPLYAETSREKSANIFLSSGSFAMQTSFMFSSLLLTYNIFQENRKNISYKFIWSAFMHRYIRLTPTLLAVVAFHGTWLMNMGNGPYWELFVGMAYDRCRKNGWSNMLYIHNFVNPTEMCLPQTWYLACDTQFFIFVLLVLKFIKQSEKRLYAVVGTLLTFQIVVLFTILYVNDWEQAIRPTPEFFWGLGIVNQEKWHSLMASHYTNLSGVAGGIFIGYIMHKYKNDNSFFRTKTQVALWWIITYGGSVGIILIPGIIIYSPSYVHNIWFASIYGALCRISFVMTLGYGFFGFFKGIGWMSRWVIEFSPTYVLGRLSYGAYISHLIIQLSRGGLMRSPAYLTDYKIIHHFAGDVVLAYGVSLITTLLFEMPTSGLVKTIMAVNTKNDVKEKKK